MRRLAMLGGSITALVAAAWATLRGRKRRGGGKPGRGGKGRRAGKPREPGTGRLRPPTPEGAARPADGRAGHVGAAATRASTTTASSTSSEPPAADELRAIRGIGSVMADRLRDAGVTSVEQIAAWSAGDIGTMADRISVKAERIVREDWVGQARAATGGGKPKDS